jgi:uncharacterized protein YkwD
MKPFVAFALAGLLLAGCASMDDMKARVGLSASGAAPAAAPQAAYVPPPPPPDPKTQMAELETRLGVLVEEARHKLDPNTKLLRLDERLVKIARARAADMAEKKYLNSTPLDGKTSAALLMDADAQYQGLLGENAAAQYYVAQSGVDPKAFAERFLETWLGSPAHRENLAFPDYDRVGVGAAVNNDTVYVALLFSTTTRNARLPAPSGAVVDFASPTEARDAPPPAPAAAVPLRGTAR